MNRRVQRRAYLIMIIVREAFGHFILFLHHGHLNGNVPMSTHFHGIDVYESRFINQVTVRSGNESD
jgi:hypothetical protein